VPSRDKRFDVVYHFLSPTKNARVRVRSRPTRRRRSPRHRCVCRRNWFERETYDLYGVLFTGHPDCGRLLTDYGFDGHPLRKDFPLTRLRRGALRRRAEARGLRQGPARQEFRNFDFLSPWEGADYGLPGDEKARGETKGS